MSRRSSRNDSAKERLRHRLTTKQRPAGPYSRRLRIEPLEDRRLLSVSFAGTYSQSFDTLPTSGTSLAWSNDSTLSGWSLFRQPAPGTAITAINANSGSSTTGTFNSFGVAGTNPLTDRALGGVASGGAYFGSPLIGAAAGWMAVALTNGTASTINTLDLSYTGEQWRDGGNTTAQTMTLEYGFGSSFTSVSTWTAAPGSGFNFTSPIHTAAAAALDGNVASNRTTGLGGTLSSLGWTADSTLWVRWVENNDVGNDHGLAIDDVSINIGVVNETLIVDTLVDEIDGNHSAGDLSLREAISLANGSLGANTITFAAALTSGGPATILLTQGELKITDALTINGPGADLLTIDASGNDPTPTTNNGDGSRVFNIDDGNTVTQLTVSINSLTMTGGDVTGNGGGIRSLEQLMLSSSTITGNSAVYGGGIYNAGTLTVIGSAISDNTVVYGQGGGIVNFIGSVTITDSTIRDNSASSGGGIANGYNGGNLTVIGSAISGNTSNRGGGISIYGGSATIIDSTIDGNSATTSGGGATPCMATAGALKFNLQV